MSEKKIELTPQQIINACRKADGYLNKSDLTFMATYYNVEIDMYQEYDPQFDISRRMDRLYYDQTI